MHGVRVPPAAATRTPEQQRGICRMHNCAITKGTQAACLADQVTLGVTAAPLERTQPGPDGHMAARALREGPAALRPCWVQPLGALQQAQTCWSPAWLTASIIMQ